MCNCVLSDISCDFFNFLSDTSSFVGHIVRFFVIFVGHIAADISGFAGHI